MQKQLLKKFASGVTSGAGFALSVLAIGAAYAAYSNLPVTGGETLSASKWNELVTYSVPPGAVMAFNLTSCPTGWSEADGNGGRPNLQGEFIRGWNKNATGVDSGRALWSWQNGTAFMGDGDGNNMPVPNLWNATHRSTLGVDPDTPASTAITFKYSDPNASGTCTVWWSAGTSDASTCVSFGRSRPRNVALLYCVKD